MRSPSPRAGSALHRTFELTCYPSSVEVTWSSKLLRVTTVDEVIYPLAVVLSRHRHSIPKARPRRILKDSS